MSFRLTTHTPTIGAAPGEAVVGRVEIFNDGSTDAIYTVVVVGLAPDAVTDLIAPPPLRVAVPAGSAVVSDVVVVVPRNLGIGQHAAAFEATSSRAADRAALTPFTVSIQSVSRVELIAHPSTIRARRNADFHLDVSNHEPMPVEIELIGEAPDVDVSFTPSTLSLQPGQRAVTKGRIRGPRHVSGEPTQHNILITARGRASTTSVTAAYVQRPLFAHRLRMVVAAVAVVALWLAAIGGTALWLSNRDDGTNDAAKIVGVDNDGDGIPDAFRDAQGRPVTGTDTNGDGIPDTLVGIDGKPLRAIDTNGDGKPDALSNGAPLPGKNQEITAPDRQETILRGTVQIDRDPTTVAIALTPIELGAAPSPTAAPIGLRSAQPSEPAGKIWSARTATLNDLLGSATRRTVAIAPDQTVPGADGVWLFDGVLQGQSYEVSFSSPGYDTQSFVLTPRADAQPIDLDVEMKPSQGALSGTVAGPSGPLGAAEVRITDGTLDFATTSASGNGTWSLPGVSTPGVYTVTATLRGFATAVRQIELEPGDKPSGITLQMVPGLGTITGIVTSAGAGLGGVTVTASNGDTTLTTTTLTEGNVGFYSLPQLAVPATYTVQATLDGYLTDSRRVPLDGSLGDVNLSMATTTTTLTGRVISSAGGGIESAGLIISTGDLQFRASTSPTGVFTIDRLPPGDYTITAEHYQHTSVTEFTTLVAGSTAAPLEITLLRTTGPAAVGTGSLVVSVINDDPKVDPPGINDARVTISRNRTSEVQTLQDPNASAVTFDNLPIGTYTINVRADGYNVSAPVTKSVGQTRERAEIQLQKLGQASGSMVNSLDPTKTPLPGYSLQLYRLANIADPVGVVFGIPIFDTNGTWTTTESALPTGLYRIQATAPTGFFVRNDQVLDTSPAVGGRAMVFLVPEITDAEVQPLSLPPIEADPYPTITAKIYQPRLNGIAVEYDAVDQPLLGVTGTCNGTPVPAADIVIADTFGPTGGAPDQFDAFTIDKEAVARLIPTTQLPGSCEFTVTAPDRIDAKITLTNIVASDGFGPSDRLAAAALVKTPTPLTGTVFWIDKGARQPLGNVTIAAAAPVITGFQSTERSATLPDPRPVPVLGASSTTSAATTGAWTLTGQVFGVSNYGFSVTNFMPGSVPVTINETKRTVPPSGTNTNVFTQPIDGSGFGIELAPPNPGTVSGRVTIQTTATPTYGTNMVRATPPIGAPFSATPTAAAGPAPANPGGGFTFANAVAGTWSIDFDSIPNHVRVPVGPTPPPIEKQLLPGGAISGFDATYTELATVRVRLFDKTSLDPITRPAGLDLTAPTTPALTGAVSNRPVSGPNDSDVYELTGIPVASSNPVTNTVGYTMAVQLADYDLASARTGRLATVPIIDAREIPLPLVAGQVRELDLYIDSLKTITGSIRGLQTAGPPPVVLPLSGSADVDVVRLNPAPGDLPFTVDKTGTDFVITGPPGNYRVTPSHPEYQDFAPVVITLGPSLSVTHPPFDLTLRLSQLSVDALTKLGGADVDGAVFDRHLGTGSCTSFPTPPVRETIPLLGAKVIDIAPGDYCLRISKFDTVDPTKEIAFPAIVQVTVPTSLKGATPRVATVVAPLPALRPTLTGKLVATNTAGATVELIATPAPVLELEFTENVSVDVNGTTIPNQNLNSTADDSTPAAPPPAVVPPAVQTDFAWTYQFTNVPFGENKITAPPIAGYTPAAATTQTVIVVADMGPTEVPDFVYTLSNSNVEIALGPGTFPSLDPRFTSTDARADVFFYSKARAATDATIKRSYSFSTDTDTGINTLTINDVAPDNGQWTLTFDDALHAPFTDDKVQLAKPLATSGPQTGNLDTFPTGDLTRLTGTATQQALGTSQPVALTTGAKLTLSGTNLDGDPKTYTLQPGDANLSGTTYIFDVEPGTYDLTGEQTGYGTVLLAGLDLTSAGMALPGPTVPLKKLATLTVRAGNRGLALPTGLQAKLLNTAEPFSDIPAAPFSGTTPSATFSVPAGTYGARTISTVAATYPQQRSALPDATFGIGVVQNINITMSRYTTFNVSGPTAATDVTVTMGTQTPKTEKGGTAIEFIESGTSTGTTATVSAAGFRTATVTVPDQLVSTIPVTLLPTTVVGAITAADEATGTVLKATSGETTLDGSITGNKYRVEGLVPNPDGTDRVWTITYTKPGVGTGSTSVTVTTTGPIADATGTIAGGTITVNPRPVYYNFTVTEPTTPQPTPVTGAAVTINPAPVTAPLDTSTTGATTGVVNENVAFTWTVKKSGFLTRYGSFPKATSLADVPVAVSMVRGVSGHVLDGTSGVNNATVVVCPSGAATPCTAAADRTFSSGAQGAFTITSDLTPDTYTVWASSTTGSVTKTGSTTLTIAANGDASLLSSNIAIKP